MSTQKAPSGTMSSTQAVFSPNTFVVLAILWWALLAVQVWYGWDLSGVYAHSLFLLSIGPETPFGVLGAFTMVMGTGLCFRRRKRLAFAATVVTLVFALWVTFASPVPLWAAHVYLWRHLEVFTSDAAAVVAEVQDEYGSNEEMSNDEGYTVYEMSTPSGRTVLVEGRHPIIAFERRAAGFLHWAAIVYDPTRSIEQDIKNGQGVFGGWGPVGYQELRGDWVVLVVIK